MSNLSSKATNDVNGPTGGATKIRLLIAEDHPALRYTLRSILKQYPEFEIVGEATNGEDAVLKVEQLQPSVVLMDISMPKLDGIEATRRIKLKFSGIAVLGLSADAEGPSVKAMLNAGAVEVIPKEKASEDLSDAVHRVSASPSPNLPVERIPAEWNANRRADPHGDVDYCH